MKLNTIVYKTVLSCFIFLTVACSKDDDLLDPYPTQPKASNFEINLGNLVGFWNFNKANGNNSISEQCGNWELNEVNFKEGHLISNPISENVSFNNVNSVIIDASEWPESKGINQFKFFSGAIRFKASAIGSNPLLTFGLSHRFLHLALIDDKISVYIPDVNSSSNKQYHSKSSIKSDTWHTLYYRVEEFNPLNGKPNIENNIYIQLDNQDTEIFNYKEAVFYKLYDISNLDRVMSFGDLSNGMRFQGECDWVMLSNGRMTPGNTQFHLKDLNP